MKTLLFFLVIGFSLCTAGKAQTSLVSTREKFRHHEISVSYGFLPITDANSIAEEFIAPTASFGIYTREKTSYYGALNISYIYRINRKISLGVTGGITGNRGTASSLYEVLDENKNDDRRYLYILPTFRWHWFTRPQFSLYSSAGLGAYFLRNSFGGDTYHKKEFAYQFSFQKAREHAQEEAEVKRETQTVPADANKKEGYYLIEEGGFLVVYASDRKTVYEYTDIAYDDLPENVRNEIRYGKYIRSQADLYGFLENYSS